MHMYEFTLTRGALRLMDTSIIDLIENKATNTLATLHTWQDAEVRVRYFTCGWTGSTTFPVYLARY